MNILIRNLPRSMTEREMLGLFLPFGKVRAHNLVYESESGKSKGFGFVDMPNHDDAVAAITALNDTTIGGLKIRVKVTAQKYEPPATHAARPRPARAEQRTPGARRTEHRGPQRPRKTGERTGAHPQRSEYNNPMRSSQSPSEGIGQTQWADRPARSGRPSGGNTARPAGGAKRTGARPQRSEYNNPMGSPQARTERSGQAQWTDRPARSGNPSGSNTARPAGGAKRTGARPQRSEYNNPMGSSQAHSEGSGQTQWTDRSGRPARSGRPSGGNTARPAGRPKHPGPTGNRQTRPGQRNRHS